MLDDNAYVHEGSLTHLFLLHLVQVGNMTPIDPAVAWTGVRGVHDGSRRDLGSSDEYLPVHE